MGDNILLRALVDQKRASLDMSDSNAFCSDGFCVAMSPEEVFATIMGYL